MQKILSWGILGTGNIAKTFARGLAGSKTGKLVAVGSRTQSSANAFGDPFKVPRCHPSYEALLADKDVQAVYIATPHPLHAEWAIKAAEAGKHILCEKPIGINYYEAMAIIEAAHRNNVFLMEAFMYRCHPQTHKLIELLREKAIGEVRLIEASFGFSAGDPEGRVLNHKLGGGGILDVGCYCTSMARLVAGVAMGQEFAEPYELKASGHVGSSSRIDEYTAAVLKFPGNIIASLSTSVKLRLENTVRILGTEGMILIPTPWIPSRDGGTTKIILHKYGRDPQEILIESKVGLYTLEADCMAENIDKKQAPSPAMTWNDTLGNMKTMDQWRDAIGLIYDDEKPANQLKPVHKGVLAVRKQHNMKYGRIPGIEKNVSRLIMGADNQRTIAHASVMFDDFIECGGNAFDVAWCYRAGHAETVLGQWVKNRNIREQIVILGKGAHTPECNPKALTRQLNESLERLQTNYLDIYMLHRDNPEIPVGEFVDVLNEHKRAGRMSVFGGSNWSIERVEAANTYAQSHGLTGFSAVSNNFSLARMVKPVWGGCIAASDPKSRAWFTKTQMVLMPWSSQARGFFTDRAHPQDRSDTELADCWYSDDNFRRKERVNELARKRNVLPINIALAYVLCQPFPSFPLIGPRTLSETRTSLPGLNIELTADEMKWLNLE